MEIISVHYTWSITQGKNKDNNNKDNNNKDNNNKDNNRYRYKINQRLFLEILEISGNNFSSLHLVNNARKNKDNKDNNKDNNKDIQ